MQSEETPVNHYIELATGVLHGVLFTLTTIATPVYQEHGLHATNYDFGLLAISFSVLIFVNATMGWDYEPY
jgi:hypothetical protein